jgi:hypothetical protein
MNRVTIGHETIGGYTYDLPIFLVWSEPKAGTKCLYNAKRDAQGAIVWDPLETDPASDYSLPNLVSGVRVVWYDTTATDRTSKLRMLEQTTPKTTTITSITAMYSIHEDRTVNFHPDATPNWGRMQIDLFAVFTRTGYRYILRNEPERTCLFEQLPMSLPQVVVVQGRLRNTLYTVGVQRGQLQISRPLDDLQFRPGWWRGGQFARVRLPADTVCHVKQCDTNRRKLASVTHRGWGPTRDFDYKISPSTHQVLFELYSTNPDRRGPIDTRVLEFRRPGIPSPYKEIAF